MDLRPKLDEFFKGWAIDSVENQGLHDWRCRYPDRYTPCNCYDDFLDEAVDLVITAYLEDKDEQRKLGGLGRKDD